MRIIKVIGIGAALIGGLVIGTAIDATAGDKFYQWTLNDSDIAAAGSWKSVPQTYKADASKRSFDDIEDDSKQTFLSITDDEYRQALASRLAKLRSRKEASKTIDQCGGTVTVTQERLDYTERGNSYNGLFYVVIDGCGIEKSRTRANPLPYIEIK